MNDAMSKSQPVDESEKSLVVSQLVDYKKYCTIEEIHSIVRELFENERKKQRLKNNSTIL
jgi:hypothetical protein